MPGPSVHDLLGLPADVTQPNAYQVFGLELGEADHELIRSAIEKRVRSLKQAKPSASPEVWTKAARAVQAAQKVLSDPAQKTALDAQYGIINDPEPDSSSVVDPLAALLPTAKKSPPGPASAPSPPPSAASQSPALPDAPSIAEQSPSVRTPVQDQSGPTTVANPAPTVAPIRSSGPQIATRRPVRRRRSTGGLIFGTIVLVLLTAIVGGFAYVFLSGGGIVVVKNNDGFAIKPGTDSGKPRPSQSAPPRSVASDGIMPTPPRVRPDSPNVGSSMPSDFEMPTPPTGTSPGSMPNMPSPDQPPSMDPMTNPSMSTPPMTAEPPMVTTPVPTPTPVPPANSTPDSPQPPTAEQIAVGDAAVTASLDAIKKGNWAAMKSLAETAETKAVTDAQKQSAETLFQFADLATFYRGAIQRAMADLVAGNEVNLTESMTFLVKQSSAEQITLYRNKRDYPYTFEELPLSVAHALAPFQLNVSSPEGQAAKAVFQAISTKATPGHRVESIEILRNLDQVEGADPKRLADLIESFRD